MKQMVYKLNLPPLEDCVIDNALTTYFPEPNLIEYNSADSADVVKSEYLRIKDFNFNRFLIFYKTDNCIPQHAHTDTIYPNQITPRGINWIYKNEGVMEFWDFNKIPKEKLKYVSDKYYFDTYHYFPIVPPNQTYRMTPGAYLVNAAHPHRAYSQYPRYSASLRPTINTMLWSVVIDQFKDLIDYNFGPFE